MLAIQWTWLGDGIEDDGDFGPPRRSYPGDAGYDLVVSRPAQIPVGRTVDVHTDIAIALPKGFFARITGRSSTLRKRGLLVNEGIIDSGYRGEMFIAVFNLGEEDVELRPGDRIAQLLIHRVHDFEWTYALSLPDSLRGEKGFGSTGI